MKTGAKRSATARTVSTVRRKTSSRKGERRVMSTSPETIFCSRVRKIRYSTVNETHQQIRLDQHRKSIHTFVSFLEIRFKLSSRNPLNHPYSRSCATAARSGPYWIHSDSIVATPAVCCMRLYKLFWFLSVGLLIASTFWNRKSSSSAVELTTRFKENPVLPCH